MGTKDEIFEEYKQELARIDREIATLHEAREIARTKLREQLKALQIEHHKELKELRSLEQRTRRKKGGSNKTSSDNKGEL